MTFCGMKLECSVVKEYLTPLNHHNQPEPLIQGMMDPWFYADYAKL